MWAFQDKLLEEAYQQASLEDRARSDWKGMSLQTTLWAAGLAVVHLQQRMPSAENQAMCSQAPVVLAVTAAVALLALRCPPAYVRHRNMVIAAYRAYALIWPTMRLVMESAPEGQVAGHAAMAMVTCSSAFSNVSLGLGNPLPFWPSTALMVLLSLRFLAGEHQSMCRLPYLKNAHPESIFEGVLHAVVRYLPLGPALVAEVQERPLTVSQQCYSLFAMAEISVLAAGIWAVQRMEAHRRARFMAARHPADAASLLGQGQPSEEGPFDGVIRVAALLPLLAGVGWGVSVVMGMYSMP